MKSADYHNAPMEKMSWNVFIGVVLGQIVSSYTLGIVGVALDRVPSSMTLSSTWLGLLGAGSLIGLFGSLLVGRLADRYGRRKFFMADMLALTLLSVLQLFTTNLAALLVIRIALPDLASDLSLVGNRQRFGRATAPRGSSTRVTTLVGL
ncbi:MFS transporter [Limosilactobacillus fermentum]|uniref:MFS transporter n=1 Tax=Limosilactobacillus fermentum TaxID=1613 RepID=UPI001E324EDB|nr:MFS transporter [Limosilactobacillus fermentum]MCD5423975.1 MFS transporter [Limosilactobacillus fermentum]